MKNAAAASSRGNASPANRGWLLLLGDLFALLLVFFVLVYAMAPLPDPSWRKLEQGLANEFRSNVRTAVSAPRTVEPRSGAALGYVVALIDSKRSKEGGLAQAEIIERDDRVVLRFPYEALDGDAAKAAIDELAPILTRTKASLVLRFHIGSELSWGDGLRIADEIAQAFRRAGYENTGERLVRRTRPGGESFVDIEISGGSRA